jgi:Spy/CpxP family protein refolding chaperone
MKTRKNLLVLAALFVALSLSAQGPQGKGKKTPEEKALKQTEMIKQKLQLTDAQAAEVQKIYTSYTTDVEKMKQEMKDRKKALNKEKDAQLKKVLTPEQYSKLEVIRAERKAEQKQKKEQMKRCMQEANASQSQP